jgi:pyruvate/2-oxoglutarate dehydrogenase complex dihydrolipoamide acyltransferase (E2) component
VTSSRTESLVDVTMPQMGVSVAEGTVVHWSKQVGDRVRADETICEISTDKIDTEVPAPVDGVLAEILVPVESTVAVGAILARIATAAAGNGAASDQGAPGAPGEPGEGAPLDSGARGATGSPARNGAPASSPADPGRRYSPVVQRIAAEHGIDLTQVAATGRGGRVRKQDVLAWMQEHGAGAGAVGAEAVTAATPAEAPEPPLHTESPYRPDPTPPAGQTETLSRVRRQIGEHMKRSLDTAAHCTTWIEVDMSRVEVARARLQVTALAFVARATIAALREHPSLNASLEGDRYTRHDAVNLGIAVSLGEDGLIVPVLHAAHELSVEGLAARIRDLARRARSRELTPDEVRGGTFTITNPGQYGSIMATPIINQPQIAILDFEAIVKRPVVVSDAEGNDSIAIRPITILGLSWDHRALDGAMSAQFLAGVKRHLETASP